MRITRKGQVPRAIREELGLLPDTEVTFRVVGDEARIRKAGPSERRASRGARVIASLRSVAPSNVMTTDEIMALMRGEPFRP